MPEAVEEFNRTHNDIRVELTDAGGGTESSAKLVTLVRAGNAPDVALIENTALPRMIVSDVATDITDQVADIEDVFTDGAWAQTTFDGAVYAVPQDVGPMALIYREDVFAEYGLDAPLTWQDYRDAAATIKAGNPDLTMASLSTDGWGWYAAVAAQAGDDWWSFEDGVWTVDIDGEGSQMVVDFFNEMYNDGLIAADPILNPSYNQKLNDGTILSWPSAVWAPGVIYGVAPDTAGSWALAPLPRWDADDPTVSYQGGSSVAVISGSEHPEEAAEFAKWLNASEEGVEILLNEGNLYPAATIGQEMAAEQAPPKLMPQQTDYYEIGTPGARSRTDFANAGPRSIETASIFSAAPAGSSSKNFPSVAASLPGAPHTMVDVAWSLTRVRYLWCLRQEISSTPMFTNPSNRFGSSTSAATRSHIAPTVRQATRSDKSTVTNHTTRSSKSAVNRAPGRANGTPSATTPWVGQSNRRRRIRSSQTRPPRSRCLQLESTPRRSYLADVACEHSGQVNTRRRNDTSITTGPSDPAAPRSTPVTRTPARFSTRLSKVVARMGGSKDRAVGAFEPTGRPCVPRPKPHTRGPP